MSRANNLEYIRRVYGVPAYRGVRVLAFGRLGTIRGTHNAHLAVWWDGTAPRRRSYLHPTDGVTYRPQEQT